MVCVMIQFSHKAPTKGLETFVYPLSHPHITPTRLQSSTLCARYVAYLLYAKKRTDERGNNKVVSNTLEDVRYVQCHPTLRAAPRFTVSSIVACVEQK